ncbi:helix-turn-helix transcriptional regulator [Amycolatopsis roodepoortensis]|uniref:helix-turn-helix domain-containing protein n=1 Tax=Amycolatopsis roodepoortensis TaxID=700274 RepID=UPI00214B635B|nr:helix-turn-helix transcriptional regulator [Amycolatopsis roodepoortensis]UUV34359.1 helix-turn-helix transcriptional regulator [Amycolatopsis roodepoortensis]
MTDPSDRRLEFGDRLQQIRKVRMTAKDFADAAGWQRSKISRIERGQSLISDPDLTHWATILDVPADVVDELRAELRAIRLDDARWRARLRRGHESVQWSFAEAEAKAAKIVVFESWIVPGLVQTPAYAEAVFRSMAELKDGGRDVAAAVAARMQRQAVLYDSTKNVQLLMTEAALRNPLADADVMAGQIDRLVAATALPTVRFGIVPLGVRLQFPPLNGFWSFDDSALGVETFHTEIVTTDVDDVQPYNRFLSAAWDVAAEGDDARTLLLRLPRIDG